MVSMVSSAVLGAAAGTGLALVVAMTIVVYRYYAFKRKGKYWNNLDRWPDPPSANKNNENASDERQRNNACHDKNATTSYVLDCWKKPQQSYYAVQKTVSIFLRSTFFFFLIHFLLFIIFFFFLFFFYLTYQIRATSNTFVVRSHVNS